MIAGRVTGTVVCTQKDRGLRGEKMLVVQPVALDSLKNSGDKIVVLDGTGAGSGELVLVVGGSSARLAEGYEKVPLDYCIIGIIDQIEVEGKAVYINGEEGE